MKKKLSNFMGMASAIAMSLMLVDSAFAQQSGTLFKSGQSGGAVVNNITNSISSVPRLIPIVCYILAGFFGIAGILKFKDHSDRPEQTKLSVPVWLIVIAVMLAAFSETIGTGIATLWGPGGQTVQAP